MQMNRWGSNEIS